MSSTTDSISARMAFGHFPNSRPAGQAVDLTVAFLRRNRFDPAGIRLTADNDEQGKEQWPGD
jgi:hypothetical protein